MSAIAASTQRSTESIQHVEQVADILFKADPKFYPGAKAAHQNLLIFLKDARDLIELSSQLGCLTDELLQKTDEVVVLTGNVALQKIISDPQLLPLLEQSGAVSALSKTIFSNRVDRAV